MSDVPTLADMPAIKEAENFHGKFIGGQGFTFKDGRSVMLFAFEKSYMIRCDNPNAPDDEQWSKQANFNLTPESFYGLMHLYGAAQILRHEGDRKAFLENLNEEGLKAHEEIESLMSSILNGTYKESEDGTEPHASTGRGDSKDS